MASNDSNVLKSALTEGSDVKEIYMFGVKVWPICDGGGCIPNPMSSYYVSWTPVTNVSGGYDSNGFKICGRNINAIDYYPSGCYENVPAFLFMEEETPGWVRTIETNAIMIQVDGLRFGFSGLQSVGFGGYYICDSAFYSCSALLHIDAPSCVYVGRSAFYRCSLLSRASMDSLYYIAGGAFEECGLINASFKNVRYIDYDRYNGGAGAFFHCESLRYVSLPKCEFVGTYAFEACHGLREAYLPEAKYLAGGTFRNCYSALSIVSLPKCEYLEGGNFHNCSYLTSIELPACTHIGNGTFNQCIRLQTLTLGYSSVCYASNSNILQSTPIGNLNGSIYVPSSLVSDYKTTSPWSYFSTIIFPIPEP